MAKVDIMERFLTDHEKPIARNMLRGRRVPEDAIEWMVNSCPGLEYVRKLYGRGARR